MTKYLLFSGELIDAATALRAGLVDQLVPAEDLEAEVHRFADVLASRSALSQRATKEVVAALAAGGDGEAEVGALVPGDDRQPASSPRGSRRSPNAGRPASPGQADRTFLFRLSTGRGIRWLRRSLKRTGSVSAARRIRHRLSRSQPHRRIDAPVVRGRPGAPC